MSRDGLNQLVLGRVSTLRWKDVIMYNEACEVKVTGKCYQGLTSASVTIWPITRDSSALRVRVHYGEGGLL